MVFTSPAPAPADHIAPLAQLLTHIADAANHGHLTAPAVHVRPDGAALAKAVPGAGGGAAIVVSAELLEAPENTQRFVAFHEIAHIALGHHRAGQPLFAAAMIAALVASVGWGILHWGDYPATATAAAAFVAVTLVTYPWAMARRRAREFAADRLAADHGVPLTAAVAGHLESYLARHQTRAAKMLPKSFRDHPTPARRLAAELEHRNTRI